MKKMYIIGHRGAAGLALENTLQSIRSAIQAGVDAVEFDVRLTKDKHLVLVHDEHTERISPFKLIVHETHLEELQSIKLHDGKRLPTLKEAMRVAGDTPMYVEPKGSNWAQPLAQTLHKSSQQISVIAFNHEELYTFSLLCPNVPVYALEHTSPFEVIQSARQRGFTGVDLNFWILNPLTYWWARYVGLEIIVYTVNSIWLARFLKFFYPRIGITTDHPHALGFLSEVQKRKRKQARAARRKSGKTIGSKRRAGDI